MSDAAGDTTASDTAAGDAPAGDLTVKRTRASLLGCGCATLVLGFMMLMVGLTVFTWWESERLKKGYGDPSEAARRVDGLLPHDRLPAGYHPLGAVKVPLFYRMAILTDLPAEERPVVDVEAEDGPPPRRFGRSGFIYFSTFSLRRDDSELVRYFEDGPAPGEEEMSLGTQEGSVAGDLDVDFEAREVVTRGRVGLAEGSGAGAAFFVARRGRLRVAGDDFPGLSTLFYVRCEAGRRVRFGLWFAPAPEPAAGGNEAAVTGTPADPRALQGFLGHFRLCR